MDHTLKEAITKLTFKLLFVARAMDLGDLCKLVRGDKVIIVTLISAVPSVAEFSALLYETLSNGNKLPFIELMHPSPNSQRRPSHMYIDQYGKTWFLLD